VMRRKTVPQVVRSFRVRNTRYEQPWKRSAEEVCSENRCLSFVFIPLGAHQGAISFPLQVLIVLLTGRGSRYCVGHVDTALNYGKHIMEGEITIQINRFALKRNPEHLVEGPVRERLGQIRPELKWTGTVVFVEAGACCVE